MMIGLPESTRQDEIKTAKRFDKIKTKNGKDLSCISFKKEQNWKKIIKMKSIRH